MARKAKRAVPQGSEPRPRRRATAVASEGRLVLAEGPATSRLFVYMAGNYIHRIERERRELYAGDLSLALVAEIIGTAAIEPGMRDAAFRKKHQHFDTPVSVQDQRGTNATSISISAGIPRETVRRKIDQLLKMGLIVEKEPARYVIKSGVLLEPHRQAAYARGIDQTLRFMNELLDHGAVRWVPAPKGKRGTGR